VILLYLLAIVVADLLVTKFGVNILPITSFFIIPFDLVLRDVLHDRWRITGGLPIKMAGLVLSGSIISYLINSESKNVAKGSFFAFVCAGLIAYTVYEILKRKPKRVKMNVANFFSAFTDSLVFQVVAFGSVSYKIVFIQWVLKFIGGFFWVLIFTRKRRSL